MKGLIENECGGQNPLMKLTAHFANSSEQKLSQDAIRNLRTNDINQQPNPDNFVSEYLGIDQKSSASVNNASNLVLKRLPAPRTFQMEALLNELKQIDSSSMSLSSNNLSSLGPSYPMLQQQQAPKLSSSSLFLNSINASNNNLLANDWSQEYWSSISAAFQKRSPLILDDRAFKWSAEYLTQTEATIFDEAWGSMLMKNSNNNLWMSPNGHHLDANSSLAATPASATNQLNEEMRKTANDLLDSMQDSRFSETEFLQFVRNLSTNGLNNPNAVKTFENNLADLVANNKNNLTEADENNADSDLANEWVKEFENNTLDDKHNTTSLQNSNGNNFWEDLQDEWNTAATADPNHPWLDEFQKVFDTYKTYEFDKENPLKLHPNPFEEGIQRLKQHDIVNAVLLFEVAVQKEPSNMLAWQYLGTTQVENEQDAQAIRALRRCLDLKPDNLIALSTLATSYTNESMQRLAFYSLIKWLKHHPDYSYLLQNDEQAIRLATEAESANETQTPFYMATMNVVHAGDFIDLQEIFLRAVRESSAVPNKIDPDLQCCLGVLFHLSGEYDKAADCFKTALQIKPNDHLLWNKLGATFANSNRCEEAIDAYYQALKLCPGFVRARYNLGIGCMNLGAYKEAVEHFLTALVQQSQANLSADHQPEKSSNLIKVNNIQQMSETIWSTLRLALSYLNRSDLYAHCISKDLENLKQEFNI